MCTGCFVCLLLVVYVHTLLGGNKWKRKFSLHQMTLLNLSVGLVDTSLCAVDDGEHMYTPVSVYLYMNSLCVPIYEPSLCVWRVVCGVQYNCY